MEFMAQKLTSFFENFLKRNSLFTDKTILQSNYIPSEILHREEQIDLLANILAPSLKFEKPSNVFIYGKTGTGKTLVAQHVASELKKTADLKKINLEIVYLNCKLKKMADTEYRLIAELARFFGKAIPSTGLPTEDVYNSFFKCIDSKKQTIILVLDEIDQLVKKTGDGIIYSLTRMNSELKNAQISIVGISNDLMFADYLDPRVKSSLSEEELVFPPYNALQIQDILKKRAVLAFKPDVLDDGIISKCAAYAAREHGDARRALELLRVACELAERKNKNKINMTDLDEAQEKIERERILDSIITQPKQFQTTIYAILLTCLGKKPVFTSDVYELYKKVCLQTGLRPLTQRRIGDIIAELDMLGIINTKIISKGRYGRTREINLSIPINLRLKIRKVLEEELGLG